MLTSQPAAAAVRGSRRGPSDAVDPSTGSGRVRAASPAPLSAGFPIGVGLFEQSVASASAALLAGASDLRRSLRPRDSRGRASRSPPSACDWVDRHVVRVVAPAVAGRRTRVNASSRPVPIFLRVICTRPRLVTSATWWPGAVAAQALDQPAQQQLAVAGSTMSMKSITMMPPMSRNRSCRTSSSAASRLLVVRWLRGCPRCR